MRKVIGILAHVDAGKTTLSERVLFESGAIRSMGRVDHRDAFLDADPTEQQRGITIYTGVARLTWGEDIVCWLDTPGHSDFSAEMERALAVLDCAVLVISAAAGIQSHTETLWRLLRDKGIPTFVFLSKTDLPAADADGVLGAMRRKLSPDMLDLRSWQLDGAMDLPLAEEIALREESLMDRIGESGSENAFRDALIRLIRDSKVFPVMAGSAMTGDGIQGFMRLLSGLSVSQADPEKPLSGLCWKVLHDEKGQRLCFVRLLGGRLSVKDEIPAGDASLKVNDLRICHGTRFQRIDSAQAGDMIVLAGAPDTLKAGMAVGAARPVHPALTPMMTADVLWDPPATQHTVLQALRTLEDEEPSLAVRAVGDRLAVQVMGRIQLEILQQAMARRFRTDIRFGPFRVLYKETIAAPALGIGHYEPLRHYAEVWLRLVPLPQGSGIRFRSLAHVDDLALNWQRLIETHVFEKEHPGVLTGSPLTDVEVQLVCGRAHLKHTEGGDFRQATYRAIRNALMQADCVLLEPLCGFAVTVPAERYGAVAQSLTAVRADCEAPEMSDDAVTLRGEAPLAAFQPWQDGFAALCHGRGTLRVWPSRYAPCRDQAAVVAERAYNPLASLEDTPDSVFCAHGAGYNVPWNEVRSHAHCAPNLAESGL